MAKGRTVLWGLAWLGVALIVVVPMLDFLTARIDRAKSGPAERGAGVAVADAPDTPGAGSVDVTVVTTRTGVSIVPKAPPAEDPVARYLDSGRTLPDYISDPGVLPAVQASLPAVEAPPIVVAPVPLPGSARPPAYRAVSVPPDVDGEVQRLEDYLGGSNLLDGAEPRSRVTLTQRRRGDGH